MSEELVEALRGVLLVSPWTVPGVAPRNRVEQMQMARDFWAATVLAVLTGESTTGLCCAEAIEAVASLSNGGDEAMLKVALRALREAEAKYRDARWGGEEASP